MNSENLGDVLGNGIRSGGASTLDDGMIWDSFDLGDWFVQAPDTGDEWRLEKSLFVYSRLEEVGVPMPEIVDYQESGPAYLVFENLGGPTLEEVGKGIESEADKEEFLGYLRQAGEALARVHCADGEEHGNPDIGGWSVEGGLDSWPEYVDLTVEYVEGFTEAGRFEEVAQKAVESIDVEKIPEARNAILHNDFTGDNLKLHDGQVYVIDLDNAIYGDPKYGLVQAEESLCWDEESREAFRTGYNSEREIEMDAELRHNYKALSLLDSAHGGEWAEKKKDRKMDEWLEYLEEKATEL